MKRSLSFLLILVLLISGAVIFTGCSDEGVQEYPVTVGDVTIEQEPRHVLVLNDSFADIISYMGYDRKIVARSAECDQEFLSAYPSIGSAGSLNAFTIISTGADLVVADASLSDALCSELQQSGLTVLKLNPAKNLDAVKELYTTLGTVLGGNITGAKKAQLAYDTFVSKISQFKTLPTGVVKTSVYLYMDEQGRLCTLTKGSFEQQLFSYNGSVNVLSNQTEAPVVASELRMGAPGCIFYDNDAVLEYLRNDDVLMNLHALRTNTVCKIPLKDFFRYGTSCAQIIYEMASFLDEERSQSNPATPDEATPDEGSPNDWWEDQYDGDYTDDWSDDWSDDYSDDDWSDDYSDDDWSGDE